MRAGDDQLAGAVEMGQRIEEVRARRAAGNDLWLAEDDGGPLFRCWIYRGRAPVLAAPGGWLELPADTVVLEDSATTPRARGRGIAPGAWTAIADSLRDEGLAHMITKVGVENEASRRAVARRGSARSVSCEWSRPGRASGPRWPAGARARRGAGSAARG